MKMKVFFLAMLLFASVSYASTGIVTWFDVRVKDMKASQEFYNKLFGWSYKEIFPGYAMISSNGSQIGGLSLTNESVNSFQGTMIYFKVEDLKKIFNKSLTLGATAELEPTNIPDFGSYAILRDINNNQIAIYSEKPLKAGK